MKRTRLFFLGFFLLIFSPSGWSETFLGSDANPESVCSWESPLNFQASQITPTSITVTWDHPAQGAAPRGYSLKIFETATGLLIDSVKVNGTEKSFTGLQMGTFYTCEIKSVCSNGEVSEHFAINTNPTIILDEIVNSLCQEPPVSSNPVGNLLNSVISNANTSDYVDWVENNSNAQYQYYYFRVSDVNSNTNVAKFIIYREQNEINFHFKKKYTSTWDAVLDTTVKIVKLYRGSNHRANVFIEQDGFRAKKTNTNGSFSIKVDFTGTCDNYAGLQMILENDISSNSTVDEIEIKKTYVDIQWEIFPNPALENLTFKSESENLEINKIMIFNHLGSMVKEEQYSANELRGLMDINININDLPAGIYQIVISAKNQNSVKKFIKI